MNKTPFSTCIRANSWAWTFILKKLGRFILYSGGSLFLFSFAVFCTIVVRERDIAFLSLFLLAVLWVINLLDLVITIIKQTKNKKLEN